jgi:RND family efflux transporter MFP subunit
MKKATLALTILLGAAIAGGGFIATRHLRAPDPATAPAAATKAAPGAVAPAVQALIELAPTDIGLTETREVRRALPLTGQLRPMHQAFMRARVAGEVMEMRVKEGETVKAGQLLARIDPAEYQARLDERVATLAANKATYENNERTRKNNEELLRKNFISQQAYDNTLANSTVALAQVKAAEANVALASKSLDDTRILAPWAGLIAERSAQVGDRAAIDMKLLNLVDLSRMEIEAAVPASEIPSVEVGQQVAFRVEGFGERAFRGSIARIAPQSAAGSRSIMVYVEMANPDGALKGGMFAKGDLTLSRRDAVTAVPIAALREERGDTVVYAIDNGRLARVPVKIGARNEDEAWAEVTSGLMPGVQVIKTNLGNLNAGVEVKVGAARAATADAASRKPDGAPALAAPRAARP